MRLHVFSFASVLILLLMASCQQSKSIEPSATSSLMTATALETASPLPTESGEVKPATEAPPVTEVQTTPEAQGQTGGEFAYPPPGTEPANEPGQPSATISTSAAGTLTPVSPSTSSPGGYPGPTTGGDQAGSYPGPESSASANSTRTPAPGGTQGATTPTGTQSTARPTGTQGIPEVTGTQGAPVEQGTPTVAPTLGLVHTQMQASDPKEFRIASGQVQLVELFAVWSPASKSMAPVMYVLEEKYKDRIHFVYLDIDDPSNGIFKSLLSSQLPPVFFLLDGEGNVLHEWQGSVKTEDFESVLDTVP